MPRTRARFAPALCLLLAAAAPVAAAPEPRAATAAPDPAALRLASVHAAVADLDSGAMLYRKNARRVVPIASITKLMTAMVVLDSGEPLDEWLTIVEREHPAANNAYTHMRTGSELPRGELLRVALMASENHAAYVLARHHPGGYDAFVAAMNARAEALGMARTRFVDPSGLAPGNRSTAADLMKMLRAVAGYEAIRRYTGSPVHTARFRKPRYKLRYGNTNVLVYRDHWDVRVTKTGYLDEAGRCLVMITRIEGRPVGMVLLDSFGTRSPIGDAGRIRHWLRTGDSGSVARAARRYERRKAAQYAQAAGAD
ncbi:MAG: D-alanyl-D-alanine endopeptidase [Halofilum sp. (in: g-proteobacteria)]|nr:D-alanyl-D-alanine endopeptidase [Halofilum sp. (in: g-proteobacteria)]